MSKTLQNSPWKKKIKEWVKRYGLAEIVSTIAAYIFYFISYNYTKSEIIAAYIATLGTSLAFYGTILVKDVREDYTKAIQSFEQYGYNGFFNTLKNLFIEFGIAEVIDISLTRPAVIIGSIFFLGKNVGIIVGKIIADIIFYVPAIISYELRKKSEKKNFEKNIF